MINLIVFILIMSVLVLVHELGHFLAAKKTGVRVEEFGLGIPPRLCGMKMGETVYSLNLLPFGGFVKVAGEDLIESEEEIAFAKNDPENFVSKTPLQRIFILGAGVFMNIMLTLVLYYILFIFTGFKSLNIPLLFDYKFRFGDASITNTVITDFEKDSPAFAAGVQPGEAILEINNIPVYSITDVRKQLEDKAGKNVTLLLSDLKKNSDSDIRTLVVKPNVDEKGKGILGVYMTKSAKLNYSYGWNPVLSAPMHSYNMISYSMYVLVKIIGVSYQYKTVTPLSESVAGPVGIYNVVGSILTYSGNKAFLGILDFVGLMSLSLAFLNIMPFPALDGGRLLFVLFELFSGKKIDVKLEANIHSIGMLMLMVLIVLVTVKDILKIFG